MSKEWKYRIEELLADERAFTKRKFVQSVYEQAERYGWDYLPSPGQVAILAPMWAKYHRRQVEEIIG